MPAKCVHSLNSGMSTAAMKMKGSRCSKIQIGWVHSWNRLMKVMPWVTSGMTTSELTT